MTKNDDLEQKLEEAKRLREERRKKLEDAQVLVERINTKLTHLRKSRKTEDESDGK